MAKFHGAVGYGENVETAPGVWQDVITERSYFGDVLNAARSLNTGDTVNSDISVSNGISVVADEYALNHFFAIRYVSWSGVLWVVNTVEVQHPRLILRLGGVYNGPTP